MKNYREEAVEFFESLSKEELKSLLSNAGFEVEDGAGEVIFTEELEGEVSFSIKANYKRGTSYSYQSVSLIPVYPRAC